MSLPKNFIDSARRIGVIIAREKTGKPPKKVDLPFIDAIAGAAMDFAAIAKTWDCNERTARRWVEQGAPLNDRQAMAAWLALRKHRPEGTDVDGASARPPAGPSIPPSLAAGAAAALRRLESQEVAEFEAYRRALDENRVMEAKLAREGWLAVSESLRHFDKLVEQSRRDSGELVPREQVESLLRGVGLLLAVGTSTLANSLTARLPLLAADPPAFHMELSNCLRGFVFAALSLKLKKTVIDSWARAALVRAQDFGAVDAEMKARCDIFEELVAEVISKPQEVAV